MKTSVFSGRLSASQVLKHQHELSTKCFLLFIVLVGLLLELWMLFWVLSCEHPCQMETSAQGLLMEPAVTVSFGMAGTNTGDVWLGLQGLWLLSCFQIWKYAHYLVKIPVSLGDTDTWNSLLLCDKTYRGTVSWLQMKQWGQLGRVFFGLHAAHW